MTFSVVIPWRYRGDPARLRRVEYVREWWGREFPEAELILADDGGEPFSAFASLNAGVRAARSDVLILSDSDVVGDPDSVRAAALMVQERLGVVWPFGLVYYLTEPATEVYLAGGRGTDFELVAEGGPGCLLALSRATFLAAGGYDERFRGWGFGDTAFAVACELLAGPGRRLEADLLHLWHPRDPDSYPDSGLYQANAALWGRYRAAMDAGADAVAAVRREAPSL